MGGANRLKLARCGDAALTDQQSAVRMGHQGTILEEWIAGRMEQGRPQQLARFGRSHCGITSLRSLLAAFAERACCTAKNTRSGVAGLEKVSGPPSPKAATASRMASRTEIASIKGGSPTALLPI